MKREGTLLVVDDNRAILSAVKLLMSSYFERVLTINNPNLIIPTLRSERVDIVLLDMNFTASVNIGNEGLFWLSEIKRVRVDLPVVMFTAYADIELAVESLKRGASDFIVKPWENSKLITLLQEVYKGVSCKPKTFKVVGDNSIYWGNSSVMERLKNSIDKVAVTDANILITGENGTGKELLAKYIHNESARRDKQLITVDLGSIAETLFESELFGHTKGSFTGAINEHEGKFEAASGGTLFLDEIGNLPLYLQAKLLTVLQSRRVVKVGSNTPVDINIRLISATNMNLERMVAEGKFREDLYYRINTIQCKIPALREREDDIAPLAKLFMEIYSERYHKRVESISSDAIKGLKSHYWSGNIRELQHTIEKAVILSETNRVELNDLLLKSNPDIVKSDTSPQVITLELLEKQTIESSIKRNGGNMSAVANELGISRQTLYNKIKRYNL
ncbi:MAG: sigma-54 dependent transcriptional regulator [Bacteroidales bacterium]